MQYRKDRNGNPISVIGYGCMRFTKNGSNIDFDKAEKEIMRAIANGINYYDTAYMYSGSEECLGRILEKNNCRDKIKIATKLPQYIVKNASQIDKYFDEELRRLRTDYIDYYLMHMFTDLSNWENLKNLGIVDWIARKKESGAIKNIGFSYHGDTEMFLKILNAYDWDFCQIQYNYVDEHTQAGRRGLEAAAEKGIPVIIMEPLRGGKLVNLLPEDAKKIIKNHPHGWSAAEWGLRWLWNQPEVTCVLSGMNSIEMVDENCRIASNMAAGSLTEDDFAVYEKIKGIIRSREKVGCTGCAYCMPCPHGVDIPGTFACYNKMYSEKKSDGRFEYARSIAIREKPGFVTQCVECGLCERHCPQHIEIRAKLKEADRALRPLPYKIGMSVARKLILKKKKA
ncbi:MAG: aldo/keto reductase [Lachnospiraceae bacterium]|nr:aldo/keto reductase [Lachnospiraceae bacterium]